jgi:hypothetical protein
MVRMPGLVAKELVDNALDAGAECRVGFLEGNGFWCETTSGSPKPSLGCTSSHSSS